MDIPVSIANTLAADVFSVALIIFHLLFDVPEIALNRQLKGVGYDLDLWLQKAQAVESTAERFADAFDYLRERRGFWGFLKGAIRPNPMRKVCATYSFHFLGECWSICLINHVHIVTIHRKLLQIR